MGNDLKQRLEALSAEATCGPWDNSGVHGRPTDFGVYAPHGRSIRSTGGFADGKDITYRQNVANAQFIAAVSNAFRSGDLVTRTEMEEAVAKAKAEEREAIQTEIIDVYAEGALHPPTGWPDAEKGHWQTGGLDHLMAVTSAIRALSEQKEGE